MEKSKINYQPDASETHQEFNITFNRPANEGKCKDGGNIKVHGKESSDVTLLDEMEEEAAAEGEGD